MVAPYQSNYSFGYHGSIEQGASLAFTLDAPCHKRALGGMETADGSAGNSDEQAGEYGS